MYGLGEHPILGVMNYQGREGPQGSQADLPHFTPLQTESRRGESGFLHLPCCKCSFCGKKWARSTFLFFIIAQEHFQAFFLIAPSNEISIPQIFGYLLYTIGLFIHYIHTKSNIFWTPKNQYLPPWGRYYPC